MHRLRRFLVFTLVVAPASVALAAGTAQATLLDLSGITSTAFSSCFPSSSVFATLTSPYSFLGDGGGSVTSTVYSGTDSCSGFFGYTYVVTNTNVSGGIAGISMPWNFLVENFSPFGPSTDAFYITGSGTAPSTAEMFPDTTQGNLKFTFSPSMGPGTTSAVFGAVSTAPPITVLGNVLNAGKPENSPFVLAPTPEPAVVSLFASGLLGMVGLGAARRRRGLTPGRVT